MSYVATGIGFCMVPDFLSAPNVSLVPVEDVQISRTIGLIGPKTDRSDIVQSFQLFATSHDWRTREASAKNLEWAR